MSDDLLRQLREQGFDPEADSVERKLTGDPDPAPTDSAFAADDDTELAAVVAALDRDVPDWRRR
ncbi:MAG: hypothetical protein JW940_18700 [Polyangiaceae bacterium]|nr:hypothetical protein [Polyangiaceae bacterium]